MVMRLQSDCKTISERLKAIIIASASSLFTRMCSNFIPLLSTSPNNLISSQLKPASQPTPHHIEIQKEHWGGHKIDCKWIRSEREKKADDPLYLCSADFTQHIEEVQTQSRVGRNYPKRPQRYDDAFSPDIKDQRGKIKYAKKAKEFSGINDNVLTCRWPDCPYHTTFAGFLTRHMRTHTDSQGNAHAHTLAQSNNLKSNQRRQNQWEKGEGRRAQRQKWEKEPRQSGDGMECSYPGCDFKTTVRCVAKLIHMHTLTHTHPPTDWLSYLCVGFPPSLCP
jgi:hypothetical protein